MRVAARTLPPPPTSRGLLSPIHVLTGASFWEQTVFCLYSLAWSSGCQLAPHLYDDGSLDDLGRTALLRLFPLARIVSRSEAKAQLERHLPENRFPYLHERWGAYPQIRKLIDPHAAGGDWKLVLDSDLLFFRRPDFLLQWLDDPRLPLHAVDVQRSYGYSDRLLTRLTSASLAPRLNVGLCGLRSNELDWDQIESWTRQLIDAEHASYYLEQALVALLLAGRTCSVAPELDYVTLPRGTEARECRAVMHHYVAGSKRWYFQTNWRKIAPAE